MRIKKLKEIEFTGKESLFRFNIIEEAIRIKESIRNNEINFQNWSKEEKNGAIKFIDWYF